MTTHGLRTTAVVAVLVAVLAAALPVGDGDPVVIHAVDVSRSTGAAGQAAREAHPDAVRFAGAASAGQRDAAGVPGGAGATDLAAGLRAALGRIPAGRAGRVVLHTDGRATTGETGSALAEARRRGVAVETVALDDTTPRAWRVDAPTSARPGDRIPVAVTVVGGSGEPAVVRLEDVATGAAAERAVRLPPGGRLRVVFTPTIEGRGVRRFIASVPAGVAEARPEAAVLVEDGGGVLRLGRAPAPAVTRARLASLGGTFTDAADPADIAAALAPELLGTSSLLVLDDLPATGLPPGAGERIVAAVRGGLGLAVIGGPHTLGPGGWARRPIEAALPVDCEPPRRAPVLLVALDVSGSMEGAVAGGPSRSAAVRRAAAALVDRAPRDLRLHFAWFDDGVRGAAGPFDLATEAGRLAARQAAGRAFSPGGGTAFEAVVSTALAHLGDRGGPGHRALVIVTDGRPAEDVEALQRFGRRLAAAGVATAVLPVTGEADADRLAAFVRAAEGRLVTPAEDDDLLVRLLEASGTGAGELWLPGDHVVLPVDDTGPFGALPSGLPPTEGLVRVEPRDGAMTWLRTDDGHAVLVAGRHGLGRAVVFAAPAAAGRAAWMQDPAGRLLAAALQWAMRPLGDGAVVVRAFALPTGGVRVTLDGWLPRPADAAPRAAGQVLVPVGDGSWEGTLAPDTVPSGGIVGVTVDDVMVARAAIGPAPAAEDAAVGADADALAALAMPGARPRGDGRAGTATLLLALAALGSLLVAAAREARSTGSSSVVQAGGSGALVPGAGGRRR